MIWVVEIRFLHHFETAEPHLFIYSFNIFQSVATITTKNKLPLRPLINVQVLHGCCHTKKLRNTAWAAVILKVSEMLHGLLSY